MAQDHITLDDPGAITDQPRASEMRTALSFWNLIDHRFRYTPDNVDIFSSVLFGYTENRFNAVQLYSLVYALLRVTDNFDLLTDFMLFMPPEWQNASLSGLHKDIAFALKDPKLWNDFLIRAGLQTKDGLPVEPPARSQNHTVQGVNITMQSPIPNDKQYSPTPSRSLLELVTGFDGSRSTPPAPATLQNPLNLPPLPPVTPTHSPAYLSTSPWRGDELERPTFQPGRTPEEEEWYRKRDRHIHLKQWTSTNFEEQDHEPTVGPAAADVHTILTTLETTDIQGLRTAALKKKGIFTTWKGRRPDLSIQVPSDGDLLQRPMAAPVFSPVTPPPGAGRPELSPLTREVLELASSSPHGSVPEMPISPTAQLGSLIVPAKPVTGKVPETATSNQLGSVQEIVGTPSSASLTGGEAEVRTAAQNGSHGVKKEVLEGLYAMPDKSGDSDKTVHSPEPPRDWGPASRTRSSAGKKNLPEETTFSLPFLSDRQPISRERSTTDKTGITNVNASSLSSLSDSKSVSRKRSTAGKQKATDATAPSPSLEVGAAGSSGKGRRTNNILANSFIETADVPDALPNTLVNKAMEMTAPSPPLVFGAVSLPGKGRKTNNSLAGLLSDTANIPDAPPDTLVPMKRARTSAPGQRALGGNKQSRQPSSASDFSYVGPIYATKRAVLVRDSRPYIHTLCGRRFRHPEDVRIHHHGRNDRRGCAGGENKDLAWNTHPSCITMRELNWRQVKEGFIILDQESMDKVNAAIAAGSEGPVDANEVREEDGAIDEAGPSAGNSGEVIEDEKQDTDPEDRELASKRRKI